MIIILLLDGDYPSNKSNFQENSKGTVQRRGVEAEDKDAGQIILVWYHLRTLKFDL